MVIITLTAVLFILIAPRLFGKSRNDISGSKINNLYSFYTKYKIFQQIKEYSKLVSEYSEIYYEAGDEEYALLTKRMTDFYLPLLSSDFGITNLKSKKNNDNRAVVVIYSNAETFRTLVAHDEALPMASYYGGVIHILSPVYWLSDPYDAWAKDYFIKHGPLIHELAHYAMGLKTAECEAWVAEGVALYYEYKYTGAEWRPDLAEQAKRIQSQNLADHFNEIDERVAYRKAFDVIKNYVAKNGEDMLQLLLAS
jgi:hypothetical protein